MTLHERQAFQANTTFLIYTGVELPFSLRTNPGVLLVVQLQKVEYSERHRTIPAPPHPFKTWET